MKTKTQITFGDFDIESRKPISRVFPAGTEVKDVLTAGNPRIVRTYRVVGLDGWLADIPNSLLTK